LLPKDGARALQHASVNKLPQLCLLCVHLAGLLQENKSLFLYLIAYCIQFFGNFIENVFLFIKLLSVSTN